MGLRKYTEQLETERASPFGLDMIWVTRCQRTKTEGLTLMFEVLDGIQNHRTEGKPFALKGCGFIVRLSGKIGYVNLNRDIDDAVCAGTPDKDHPPEGEVGLGD